MNPSREAEELKLTSTNRKESVYFENGLAMLNSGSIKLPHDRLSESFKLLTCCIKFSRYLRNFVFYLMRFADPIQYSLQISRHGS
jgi:hypothetical protein